MRRIVVILFNKVRLIVDNLYSLANNSENFRYCFIYCKLNCKLKHHGIKSFDLRLKSTFKVYEFFFGILYTMENIIFKLFLYKPLFITISVSTEITFKFKPQLIFITLLDYNIIYNE